MINHIDIAASQKSYKIDAELAKYIQKKIGRLDRHMKRSNRDAARADVKLKESTGKGGKKCTCEVILHVPDKKLTASESTVNMYAAVDIVEAKLQNQLKRHKEKHSISHDKHKNSRARRVLGKFFK
ncbi:MAG: putative sigma-54 modulation protein [Candidatus Saccharimonadales bacterium]|jgi:putative sigma-54 modulation protein